MVRLPMEIMSRSRIEKAVASKKFKNKTCAYCGVSGVSETGDHIFARQFFMERDRAHLAQVPACASCNNEKSKLENHLLQVLPLGSIHESASEMVQTLMPKRAARQENRVLQEILGNPKESVVLVNQAGQRHEREPALLDANTMEEWFGLVARGLAYFHWDVVKPHYDIVVRPIANEAERDLLALGKKTDEADRVEGDCGQRHIRVSRF